MNHMLPELSRWVEDAMEQEREAEARARGELEDDEVTRLCPDEAARGAGGVHTGHHAAPGPGAAIQEGERTWDVLCAAGRCTQRGGARQDNVVKCPDCGAAVVAYLETSDRYKANYVQDLVTIQKGTDGATLFLRQWHLCRDTRQNGRTSPAIWTKWPAMASGASGWQSGRLRRKKPGA